MPIVKIFFLFIISHSLLFAQDYMDTIALAKVKKLVQKEELIGKAYKEYIRFKGNNPSSVDDLINGGYLHEHFDKKNPLTGTNIKLASEENQMDGNLHKEIKSKSFLYDYYFSNSNRVYTQPPLSKEAKVLQVVLSSHEKYILNHKNSITTDYAQRNGKFHLDGEGILHWYDSNGAYKLSLGQDIIIDESVTLFDGDGNISTEFKDIVEPLNILYAGQIILHIEQNSAKEYLYLGELGSIVKIGDSFGDTGKTMIQVGQYSGAALINGDIYAWGNNANRITTINRNSYTKENSSNSNSSRYPVITSLVRSKVKTYDVQYNEINVDLNGVNYYSSPLRPKFIDFFSSVTNSTCAVSAKGELYCGGSTGVDSTALFTNISKDYQKEVLYRSRFFDGQNGRKAVKVIAMNQLWIILANANNDAEGGYRDGEIYRWGKDFAGFSGNSSRYTWKYYNTGDPTQLNVTDNHSTKVLFRDITYLSNHDENSYKKIGALSNDGDIWIWGLDNYSAKSCIQNIGLQQIDLCKPYKVVSEHSFVSIQGGVEGFIAKSNEGKYYRIRQQWGELPEVSSIDAAIQNHSTYIQEDDSDILSVDLSQKTDGSSEGIVWINGKNELKGDYITATSDAIFVSAIKTKKWKKIKVLNTQNAMCAIDISNQMYCWGVMSSQQDGWATQNKIANTFMLPVFNSNVFDEDKDYLVVEGGYDGYLTNMTSNEWKTTDVKGNSEAFFLKYPTYIGGFNYDFTFK